MGAEEMDVKVLLNKTSIEAINFNEEIIMDQNSKDELHKITFDFHVTTDEYHEITTLLYTNDFAVKVAEKSLEFRATIFNYSTSITDLYQDNEIGLFHLELLEKI